MTAPETDVIIQYQGEGQAGSYWGATLVYFDVDRPHDPAMEVGVLLGNDAAIFLAEALGRERNHEFEVNAARVVGEAWLRKAIGERAFLAQSITLSAANLREDPDLVEIARLAL